MVYIRPGIISDHSALSGLKKWNGNYVHINSKSLSPSLIFTLKSHFHHGTSAEGSKVEG